MVYKDFNKIIASYIIISPVLYYCDCEGAKRLRGRFEGII